MSPRESKTPFAAQPVVQQRTTRCLVVGNCKGLPELLAALRDFTGIEMVGSKDGAAALAEGRAEVILHATDGESEWVAELASIRSHTDIPVVLVSSSSPPGMLDSALEAGVEDVLVLPEPVENVAFAIRRAGRSALARRTEGQDERGVIATVFSPKGGTGKTVVSTNLATALAKDLGKRTLLVDLDLQFGDSAILLGIEPERTLSDLASTPGELDSEKLSGYVAHHSSGLDVLAAPLRPEGAEVVSDEGIARVLDVARHAYEAVVIDTAPLFHGAVLTAIDWTDELLVVCSPDVASLKNVYLSLRTLSLLSFPTERMRLVLNNPHAGGGLTRSEVEGALPMKVSVEVPYDRRVRPALNRGVPAVVADPKGGVAVAVRELAGMLLPAPAEEPRRRRAFGRA
jgi:pilus assembly protein CpaE